MAAPKAMSRRTLMWGLAAASVTGCGQSVERQPIHQQRNPDRALAEDKAPPGYSRPTSDIQRYAEQLGSRMPSGFSLVVEEPFVVLGDEQPEQVARRAAGTVRWARDRLEELLFDTRPAQPLAVWLFKDADSYEHHTEALFGEKPSTPYGYYSSNYRALVMNIATGGGTLVHEMVHPYVEADFPECPAWFNEGLGSLFEQSAERNGQIVGLTNWRLDGLQRTIASGKLPSFRELTALEERFYTEDKGSNYGQARYLCLLLQERGLLTAYYRDFRANHREDPTGYRQLLRILDRTDMGRFQIEWERWVTSLRF